MRKICRMVEVVLGLFLLVSVLARLLFPQVIEAANFPAPAQDWLQVMSETGYLQPLLYITEGLSGLALVLDLWVPMGLIVLGPIVINIALFHIWLDPRPTRMLIVLLLLGSQLLLCYHYRTILSDLWSTDRVLPRLQKRRYTKVLIGLTTLLGALFAIAGTAKLLIPGQLSLGDPLIDGIKRTGYLYPLLGTTESLAGIALLVRRFIPLVLLVLAPITINIFLYHCVLNPRRLPIAILIVVIHAVLAGAYFSVYRRLLQARVFRQKVDQYL